MNGEICESGSLTPWAHHSLRDYNKLAAAKRSLFNRGGPFLRRR